jgi:hypothetical protein
MGKVLDCNPGSSSSCCCVPAVIHEWVGCKDLSDYFSGSESPLSTITSGCAPCNTGCENTQGWRIINVASGNPGSGDCGEWDYSYRVIDYGDVLMNEGACYFDRCAAPTGVGVGSGDGGHNFCPSGCCTDPEGEIFQLQFGCNGTWPDNSSEVVATGWMQDCEAC